MRSRNGKNMLITTHLGKLRYLLCAELLYICVNIFGSNEVTAFSSHRVSSISLARNTNPIIFRVCDRNTKIPFVPSLPEIHRGGYLHDSSNTPPFGSETNSKTSLYSSTSPSDDNKLDEDEDEQPLASQVATQAGLFLEMALPYYKESSKGRWLFAGMIGMTLLNSGVSVAFSYVGKDFWNALSSKDQTQFYEMLWKYAAALLIGSPVSVLYRFQRERLSVNWREWMTDRTIQLYTTNRVYYALERGSEIDNPDQRISEDVRSFTQFSLQLFLTIVTSLIDLVSFSLILYSIQPQLFGAIILYAMFGTITTTSLGRKLVGLNYQKLLREANFRYSLVRIRDNAESIAFYAGEDIEGKEISKRLEKVIQNKKEINEAQRNLEFFTTSYNYFVQILPVWVVSPQYFSGAVQLGVVSQSAGAFNHILSDLSVIVNQFEQLSSFSAAIDRLSTFMSAIRDVGHGKVDGEGLMSLPQSLQNVTNVEITKNDDQIVLHQNDPMSSDLSSSGLSSVLSMKNLTLTTPDMRRTLIENLDLSIKEGENLLIVGNSGSGKSSLLRAIAGLWSTGHGAITRPSDKDVYFLPQRPYCAIGSLKDQLLYPSLDEIDPDDYPEGHRLSKSHILRQSLTDQDLLDILEQVDLAELAQRSGDGDPIRGLYSEMDWSNILSLGEQQRLAFGRLLVNQPRFVILDEATSALDMASEAKMYNLLQSMSKRMLINGNTVNNITRPRLTYVSVGHRPSLLIHHDVKLRLSEKDGPLFTTIEKSAADILPTRSANM